MVYHGIGSLCADRLGLFLFTGFLAGKKTQRNQHCTIEDFFHGSKFWLTKFKKLTTVTLF
jgi:hypothetical protein